MDDQKRRDDGMVQRRKVLGDAWVNKSIANRTSFNTDFQDLITRYAWGDIWTRPHFDHRTRRVLVIGTLVALGQWDEFRLHVRAAAPALRPASRSRCRASSAARPHASEALRSRRPAKPSRRRQS